METVLVIALFVSFIYAFALLATLAVDLVSGRFKRLKSLRTNMDETRSELDKRRNRSDKFWETV